MATPTPPRFADPSRCLDCRRPLTSGDICQTCGLPLTGPLAVELFRVLTRADQLLVTLRASGSAPAATPRLTAPTAPPARRPLQGAAAPPAPAEPRRRIGVPALLLGLGAVCVLVAALVFLALTWSALGVAGRTLVLVGLTAAAGAGAALSLRKELRGAAESLTAVALGLFTFDLAGAWSSGWSPTGSVTEFSLGAALLVAGVSTVAALRSALVVPQLAAAAAYLVAAAAAVELFAPDRTLAGAAVLLGVALALGVAHLRLAGGATRLAALGPALVAAGSALVLGVTGLERTVALTPASFDAVDARNGGVTWGAYWSAAWPLLLLAALLAGAVHVAGRSGRLSVPGRGIGHGVALLTVVLTLAAPHVDTTTALTVVAGVAAVAFAAAGYAAARAAGRGDLAGGAAVAARAGMVGSLALLGIGLLVPAAYALEVVAEVSELLADRSTWLPAATRIGATTVAEPWVVPLAAVAAAAVVTLLGAAHAALVPGEGSGPASGTAWAGAWLPVVAAAAVVALLGTGVTVAVATGALLALAVVGGGCGYAVLALAPRAGEGAGDGSAVGSVWAGVRGMPGVVAVVALAAGCLVAWASVPTTFTAALTVTAVLVAALVWVVVDNAPEEQRGMPWVLARGVVATGWLLPAAAALAAYTGALLVAGVDDAGRTPGVLAYLVALGSGVGASVRSLVDRVADRAALAGGPSAHAVRRVAQLASAAVAVVAFLVVLAATSDRAVLATAAVLLTVAAVTAAGVGIVWSDRAAGTVGAGLALLATWVRLVDVDVDVVEAYTVPLAVVLLGIGLHALLRPGRGSLAARVPSTWSTLSPGLLAGLVPSLVLVLDDPVSLRAVVLGAVCLALVTVGAVLRAGAPLLHGAWVGLLLVLVELAPYGGALPRWVLIGATGVALLVAGVRWEALVAAGRSTRAQLSALR